MLHFNLEKPVRLKWFGDFVSPEKGWKHLTRNLLEYELMIVTEGVLYIADDREEYTVRAGEYLIMPPTPFQHGTKICRCRFYWGHFDCPALPATLTIPKQGALSDPDAVKEIATRLLAQERRDHRGVRSHYLATELLLEIARGRERAAENALYTPPSVLLCAKIKDFIEWRRFSDTTVAEIARELGYHEKYLSVVFSRTEGVTLKSYISQTRLKEAKRLLLEGGRSVSEVAGALNFSDPHNFSRFFKNVTGLTPREFRENNLS